MTAEQLEKIFEETDSKWEGDNAFAGCKILAKYFPDNVIQGANHDVIYGPDTDDLAAVITEEDAKELALLNWHIDTESCCIACFV